MVRLNCGDDPKIDMINNLVIVALSSNVEESKESLNALLNLFHPMILKTCKKWSMYFNDENHSIKPFSELVADAQFWFVQYTLHTYDINGSATYNKFIKDHIDQRIRYIFECEIKYRSRNIFPNTSKDNDNECDVFDNVINKYTSGISNNIEDDYFNKFTNNNKHELAKHILSVLDSDAFNSREREIFIQIVCNGVTHEEMGIRYEISRTRITQILAKIKSKLYKHIEGDQKMWDLIDGADIEITNPKL